MARKSQAASNWERETSRKPPKSGRLTPTSIAGSTTRGVVMWSCNCDCGRVVLAASHDLARGAVQDCGNQCALRPKKPSRPHDPTRVSYNAMLYRCCSPASKDYPRYGGRGITVCDRWLAGFANFLEDMGPRPAGTSLERKDVNAGYAPDNCIWAAPKVQASNRTNSKPISFGGVTRSAAEWARSLGISDHAMYKRLKKWSVERALTEPRGKPWQHQKAR